MSSTPKFAHVVFQTSRLQAMRDWYCTVLEAHVVHERGDLCFITFDDEHHRIAFISPPGGGGRRHIDGTP
jgi:catechol 2,3-dioxygenase-like lactoylglutathione lyase family enzyme